MPEPMKIPAPLLRDILDWHMCSDPWPDGVPREAIDAWLEEQARAHGFQDWVEAYHELPRGD